ncbi:MAG: fatty acid desaturase [Parachlamydiaceae bacterium]
MRLPVPFNWGPVTFLVVYHLALLISLPFYFYYTPFPLGLTITAAVLLYITGLSITGGYHRYYAHHSYRTNSFVEAVLLFFGAMTAQGSALRWSFDHRLHHAHVDTDNDPYSIKKGFWYAHCLWIMEKPRKIEPKLVSDLMKNKLVMFQHNYYKPLMIGTNAIVVLLFGWIFSDFLGALLLVWGLRMLALHHFTWFINSLAHMWGDKPFCQELSAVDNYFLSILTFGEGYHNYHHTFANDYRNGICWFHYDPTKWLIWTLNKLGLAENLRRVDAITIQKRIVIESKSVLLEQIKKTCTEKKDELEQLVQEMSDQIVIKIAQFSKLREEYLHNMGEQPREMIKEMRRELKLLKKSLRRDWREWMTLSKNIMKLETA